ncbi:MAG TPA: hypothetical protein PKY59_24945 [Pyrinomonadaceae bacterium]|nr:hypothetical protein [Pyrinomonadaceae bacterium]
MLNIVGKIVAILLLPFLAYGFGSAFYEVLTKQTWQVSRVLPFAIGFILFAFFWLIFKRFLQVFCTFEHELTHLIVGLLFFKKPKSFRVTFTSGGYVEMYGGHNFLVTLAPYFLPTVCCLILPIAWFLPEKSLPIFLTVLGASTAFHLLSGWQEFHFGQSDLHEAGLIFSILFLPVANLIFFGAILTFVIAGNDKFFGFWKQGFVNGFSLIKL